MSELDLAIRRTQRNRRRIWNAYYAVVNRAKYQGWFTRTLTRISAKFQRDRLLEEALALYVLDCMRLLNAAAPAASEDGAP